MYIPYNSVSCHFDVAQKCWQRLFGRERTYICHSPCPHHGGYTPLYTHTTTKIVCVSVYIAGSTSCRELAYRLHLPRHGASGRLASSCYEHHQRPRGQQEQQRQRQKHHREQKQQQQQQLSWWCTSSCDLQRTIHQLLRATFWICVRKMFLLAFAW